MGERRRPVGTPVGERVLAEDRDILTLLTDRDGLAALPEGSLGKTYADFMTREQISADGLVDASDGDGGGSVEDPQRARFGTRLRDTHDLWHVVSGYNRDLLGEASLLAFTFAQTRNPGIGVIVAMAYWLASSDGGAERRMIREGYRRGRQAAWLPAADWEALMSRSLDSVRAELRVGDPPRYEQIRSEAGEAALASQ